MYVSQGYRPLLLMHAIIKGIAAIFIYVSGALCKQMFQVRWNINQREVLTESKTTWNGLVGVYFSIMFFYNILSEENRKAQMFS